MKIGTVTGTVQSVRTAECLAEQTLLTVRTEEEELAAVDMAGAKAGDKVLLATGTAASHLCMEAPVDAAVVAVLKPEKS